MFLKNLDALIAERKINKNILAKESGIPYTTIDGFYKKGWDNVKLSTLLKLAEYFDVSLDWLVLGDEAAEVGAASGDACTLSDEEKALLELYRADNSKKALFDKVVSGEINEATLAAAKKSEPAPAPVRRQRRKDDIIIF